jgi:hypothetical protein
MHIPKRYEDLTVEQFQQLEALKIETQLDKIDMACKRLSILSGESIDYIEALKPSEVYNHLLDALFLTKPLLGMECPESVFLGFKKFKYIKEISQYTTAQQKDFTEFVKQNGNDYIKCLPELMAICHLELTIKGWVYNPDNHQKNVEIFKNSKLKDSLGAVFFYSKYLISYSEILKDCLEESMKTINNLMEDGEFQDFLNSGAGTTQ